MARTDKKVLIIGALGDGPDGMSQATIVLRDIWLNEGVPLEVVDFFDNGGAGVGVSPLTKIKSSKINQKKADRIIPTVDSVYLTPKLSPLGFLSVVPYMKSCLKYKVPYTLHFHGRAFQRNYKKYPFFRPIFDKYITKSHINIALTNSLLNEIQELGIGGSWTTVGNYSQDFMMLKSDEISQKKQLCYIHPIKIAYMSNIIESKGIFHVMEAVGGDDRFALEIAGKVFPDEEKRFYQLLNEYNNIKFLGFISGDEKREMLKRSAIFILPTLYPTEAQPISLIEALCLGCIIVATEHIGIMDTLGESYPKDLYVKQDVINIQKRLNDIYNNYNKYSGYILSNLETYQNKFSQSNYADNIYNTLDFK